MQNTSNVDRLNLEMSSQACLSTACQLFLIARLVQCVMLLIQARSAGTDCQEAGGAIGGPEGSQRWYLRWHYHHLL